MKVLITGANGYVASLIQMYNTEHEYISIDKEDLDFSNPDAVKDYFEKTDFDIVVHTAGLAVTQICEEQPELTRNINTVSTNMIADVCKAKGKRMVFFSTEQCFNGKTVKGPFKEEAKLESVSKYGIQKAEADLYIRENLEDYIILRFSWLMGLAMPRVKASANIVGNTLAALKSKTPTKFTVNEVRGMTYAQHVADYFNTIITMESGVYHLSSVNNQSTYDAAKYIAKEFGYSEEDIASYILPDHERYADRRRDYRLDNTKIKAAGVNLTTFEDDIARIIADFGR